MLNKSDVIVCVIQSHGCNTSGKRSLDGRLKEGVYSREVCAMIIDRLHFEGFDVRSIVPECDDVPLRDRVERVNKIVKDNPTKTVFCIELHCDAAPGSIWTKARGFSCFVARVASKRSKQLATVFHKNILDMNLTGNRVYPETGYKVAGYYTISNTACPHVLVECDFMTNRDSVDWLLSEKGKQTIVCLFCKSVREFVESL